MKFRHWIGVSLLLHAAVLLPLLLTMTSGEPPVVRKENLNVELFGMVTELPVEELVKEGSPGIPDLPFSPPKPKPAAPPEPAKETPVEEPAQETTAVMAEIPANIEPLPVYESPVVVSLPAGADISLPTASYNATGAEGGDGLSVPAMSGGSGGSGGTDAVNQRGKSVNSGGAGEANPLNIYTTRVANRLQANLVYPEKMRRDGIEAVTTIAFTITGSGQIKRNSLNVRKSSGYKEMDDNAVRAARESAPFDKPPKELSLVIDVAFEIKRGAR